MRRLLGVRGGLADLSAVGLLYLANRTSTAFSADARNGHRTVLSGTADLAWLSARKQMRWMAPAHGIWVPKCEGHQAFTSKMGAIRYADYHDRPRLGQARFSGPRH